MGSSVSEVEKESLGAIEARKMRVLEGLSAELVGQAQTGVGQGGASELLLLRQESGDAWERVNRSSSSYAGLDDRRFLDVGAAAALLKAGSLLLSYWTNEHRAFLFVLGDDGHLVSHELPIELEELVVKVRRFRNLVEAAAIDGTLGELRGRELRRLGQDLYELLLSPAEASIENSARVLIVADGPLHYLPFGALVRTAVDASGSVRDQYLAEWKPLHSALSATSYAGGGGGSPPTLRSAERAGPRVVVFGDPEVSEGVIERETDKISDARVRSAIRRGAVPAEPLYFSRREAEGIVSLYLPGEVQVFLGADATEERARAVGGDARILHFATHAYLDDQLPLDSALVLAMPQEFASSRDNGLLQVWEIFEKVRLDADLIVLSGCQTAMGEEQGGEGLIGLTRAFQFAGAQTVMASLWSVQDQATSELMIRFYKHLRAGLTKDEALRHAQMELIGGPIEVVDENGQKTLRDFSAPYYWAGFQLYGDWK